MVPERLGEMKESKTCEKEPEIYAVRDLTGLLEK